MISLRPEVILSNANLAKPQSLRLSRYERASSLLARLPYIYYN